MVSDNMLYNGQLVHWLVDWATLAVSFDEQYCAVISLSRIVQ